jgi:hypothetical protein
MIIKTMKLLDFAGIWTTVHLCGAQRYIFFIMRVEDI